MGPAESARDLTNSERAELERLREEIAGIRARAVAEDVALSPGRWRLAVGTVLVVLGCLLAPLAVVAVWVDNQVSDTDRYVENVAPLAADPAIQDAVTNRVTNVIFGYVDVEQLIGEAVDALASSDVGGVLPPGLQQPLRGLSGAAADGVRGFVHDQVAGVVRSDEFERAWVQANRIAHQEMVRTLSGEEGNAVRVQGETVSIDLAAFIEVVKGRLSAAGLGVVDRVPEVHPTFEIAASRDLVRMQAAYRWLDRLALLLPILALGLILLGVYMARGHRRMLAGGALGLAAAMLVLAVGLAIGRTLYLDALPDGASVPAAAALYDTLVRFLRIGLRLVLVAALLVAIAAFLVGPSPTAMRLRSDLSRGIARARAGSEAVGLRTGSVGSWVYANRTVLRASAVVLAGAVLAFWDRPTGKVVLLLAALLVLVLAIIEFLGRPPPEEERRPA